MNTIRHIIRGCGYLPGYGSPPGTPVLILFVLMGGLAGAQRAGWVGFLGGAGVLLAVFGPLYLYGSYERSREEEQARKRVPAERPPETSV